MSNQTSHSNWSSTTIFVLSAIGGAVGLGNIWRFPYLAGENGGGAFVLIYLLCITFIALPLLKGELMMGRMGKQSPINAMKNIITQENKHPAWIVIGYLGICIAFLVMTFYSIVAGWALDYSFTASSGAFNGLNKIETQNIYNSLLASPYRLTLWHSVFMGLTVMIIAGGLKNGIEKAIKWLMPILFTIVIFMAIYSTITADFSSALDFLLAPDFSKLTAESYLLAASQAFFSVAIGFAAMMTYGAYLPSHVSIPKTTAIIVFADTLVAILAGFAIFPLVFKYGLSPDGGTGLVFVTLPIAFGQMYMGSLIGTVFFLLLGIAALTSMIATLEPVVAWIEEKSALKRITVTILISASVWLIGLGSVFSLNILKDYHPLSFIPFLGDKTIFDLSEYISIVIMLPISGLLIAIFSGWILSKERTVKELGLGDGMTYRLWHFLVRWLGPCAILSIFFFNLT